MFQVPSLRDATCRVPSISITFVSSSLPFSTTCKSLYFCKMKERLHNHRDTIDALFSGKLVHSCKKQGIGRRAIAIGEIGRFRRCGIAVPLRKIVRQAGVGQAITSKVSYLRGEPHGCFRGDQKPRPQRQTARKKNSQAPRKQPWS